MIGTSDQSCWLAEACKILLLSSSGIRVMALTSQPFWHFCKIDCRFPLLHCSLATIWICRMSAGGLLSSQPDHDDLTSLRQLTPPSAFIQECGL